MNRALLGAVLFSAVLILVLTLLRDQRDSVTAKHRPASPEGQSLAPQSERQSQLIPGIDRAPGAILLSIAAIDAETLLPIVSASVVFHATGQAAAREVNALGIAEIHVAAGGQGTVDVSAEGYNAATRVVGLTHDQQMAFPLVRDSSWISGVVKDAGGRAMSSISVCAWPAFSYPQISELADGSSNKRVLRCITDSDGRFAVRTDSGIQQWTVAAAANGFITADAIQVDEHAKQQLSITVYALHGCIVQWVETGGGPIRTSGLLVSGRSPDGIMKDANAARVSADWPGLGILGLSEYQTPRSAESRSVFLYIDESPKLREELGPLDLKKRVPGYEPASRSITLPHVKDRLGTIPIQMTAVAHEWCDVVAVIVGSCHDERERSATLAPVVVTLTHSTTTDSFSFALPTLGVEAMSIGGIPYGTYIMKWEASNHWYSFDSNASGGGFLDFRQPNAELLIDASELGCLEFELLGENRRRFDGLVVARIESIRTGKQNLQYNCSFTKPPYLFENLPSGNYVVHVLQPPSVARLSSPAVQVKRGERAVCEITLR
jgi:hypothetical protein